jgi:hypothetical protein
MKSIVRDRVKRRLIRHYDWRNGTLKDLLGVQESRDLRMQHLRDFLTLYPEHQVLADFDDPPWSARDEKKIRARMALRNEWWPF